MKERKKVKLPKFFRSLTYASIPVFLVSLVLFGVLAGLASNSQSGLWDALVNLVGIIMVASFATMVGSIIANPLVRAIENALLRRFGRSATATVMDFYYVESGRRRGRKLIEATRIKLEVHDPDGGSFIAVAEESSIVGDRISNGQTVPVKFDPRTHEVALNLPKRPKRARKDF